MRLRYVIFRFPFHGYISPDGSAAHKPRAGPHYEGLGSWWGSRRCPACCKYATTVTTGTTGTTGATGTTGTIGATGTTGTTGATGTTGTTGTGAGGWGVGAHKDALSFYSDTTVVIEI